MTRPPQTEEDERANLLVELGWLTGRALQINGKLPHAIVERMPLNLNSISTASLACLCVDIRLECPALNDLYEEALRRPFDDGR